MAIEIRSLEGDLVVIRLSGRLDLAWVEANDVQFSAVASHHRKVVVDLADVSYLASLGIRTLVLSAKAARSNGGEFLLANPQPMVQAVLAETGMTVLLPVAPSVDDAVARLQA